MSYLKKSDTDNNDQKTLISNKNIKPTNITLK